MISLKDMGLLDILPNRISDEEMEALAYAIDPEMQDITDAIVETVILPRIDELPEELIDMLAWQLHVDFYEPLGLDLEIRRDLVRASIVWHMHKGTKYVLEDMLGKLFLDDFSIEEWFEYGGLPYFFRIITDDIITDYSMYSDLIRAVYELKNERSWLESIVMRKRAEGTIFIGITNKIRRRYFVDGRNPWEISEIPLDTRFVAVGKSSRWTTIEYEEAQNVNI